MKADVLLGLQWGDEGKGKIVDVLTPQYDVIARFQGGPNAGHTLEFNDIKHVLHTIPSGIFREGVLNIVGNGVVIDPVIMKEEVEKLSERGVDLNKNLVISKKAHLILPTHRMLDAASESSKGEKRIGSTLKGIGPTYMDKTGRNGLRVGDIFRVDFRDRYNELLKKHSRLLRQYDIHEGPSEEDTNEWFEAIDHLKGLNTVDSEHHVNQSLNNGKNLLAEGAQGALLDIDFGSYPFVTSSNTTTAGACTGLGIAPNRVGEVIGIFKAYCTRVGSGPFPTELFDQEGEDLRKAGNEFGATTGRPRRCGWLDLPALKYSVMINGVTKLAMTKADVLNSFEKLKVCTHYVIDGNETDSIPFDIGSSSIEPQYVELDGWKEDLTNVTDPHELPENLTRYMEFIEDKLGVPITIVSVGPDRSQTLERKKVPA